MKIVAYAFVTLAATVALVSLGGCGTTGGDDPYTRLENRVVQASAMGNNTVARSLETARCPKGMVAKSDKADVRSDADVRYSEEHGRSGGQSVGRGTNSFKPYSSASVEVRAEADSSGRRKVQCVVPAQPIALTLPPAR